MNVPGQSAIRKITPVLVSAALMGFCGAALANNKMQTIEFDGGIPSSDPVWVECLGEYVYGPFHVTAKTHAFETPSGTFHFVENWDLTQELTGASTGRVWLIKSVSPATDNLVKTGEVFGYTEIALARPVDQGPKWRYNLNVKAKFDENGGLVSFSVKFATGDFKCLGPDQ